ncbi:MAG: NAD-dependent epimerase/dehydratase family protein [Anaerolineae bacterium]
MQKALVTGANGFIGSALSLRLLSDGVSVRAMCRKPSRGAHLAAQGAEVVAGDLMDLPRLTELAQGCDVIFNIAAALNGSGSLQYHINVIGTRYVAQAAHAAGVKRLVHMSSLSYYGLAADGEIDEDYTPRHVSSDSYGLTKMYGEKALRGISDTSGLPISIIRPGMVYGEGSDFWGKALYRMVKRFGAPRIGRLSSPMHAIHVDDVVDLTVTLAKHDNAVGYAFNAAPDPAPTWDEFLAYFQQISGNYNTLNVPLSLLQFIAPLAEFGSIMMGNALPVRAYLRFLENRATYSMRRARERLAWQPRLTLEEGMRRTEAWLKQLA